MDIVIGLLSGLINILLVAAIWLVHKKAYQDNVKLCSHFSKKNLEYHNIYLSSIERIHKKFSGLSEKAIRKAAISEKFAERAFNMASAANLGVVALQKSLATPKIMTAQQSIRNQLAKKEVDKMFTTDGGFDFLRPILSDEENDILDSIEQQKLKAAARANGVS